MIAMLWNSSCSHSNFTNYYELLSQADSATIYQYTEANDHVPIKKVSEISKEELNVFRYFLQSKTADNKSCGFDGTIFFYKKGEKLFNLRFSAKEDCYYASYMLDDKLVEANLSNVAIHFLHDELNHDEVAYRK